MPTADPSFIAALEDVLEVYARPFDPLRPLVCLDESGKELQAHARPLLPPRAATAVGPALPARIDSEYIRQGSANLFLWIAPHLGQRGVVVTQRRTATDFACVIRHLVEERFPAAERIVLVLDNLNTHRASSLYSTFPAAVARALWAKLEVHYTPIHGSWVNIAEPELSVLARQCLRRRIGSQADLDTETAAWVADRNQRQIRVDWHFTTADARVKLKHLYPVPVFDK